MNQLKYERKATKSRKKIENAYQAIKYPKFSFEVILGKNRLNTFAFCTVILSK